MDPLATRNLFCQRYEEHIEVARVQHMGVGHMQRMEEAHMQLVEVGHMQELA